MSDIPTLFWVAFCLTLAGLVVAVVFWGSKIHRDLHELTEAVDDLDQTWNVAARQILPKELFDEDQP